MQVEMRVQGRTVADLEANARAALDKVAGGRAYTFTVAQAHGSTPSDDELAPTPLTRIARGHDQPQLSGYATATFPDP